MKSTRIAVAAPIAFALLAALDASPSSARAGEPSAAEVTYVRIDEQIYPLVLDLNANGIPESLLLRREARRADIDEAPMVQSTVEFVEAQPIGSRAGTLRNGRRYLHVRGGLFELDGLEPADTAFAEETLLVGAAQTRYAMLGLLVIPMRARDGGETQMLRVYNTERGVFSVALGDGGDFGEVEDPDARTLFASALGGGRGQMAELRVAMRRPFGPTP